MKGADDPFTIADVKA